MTFKLNIQFKHVLLLSILLLSIKAFSQAPNISYTNSQAIVAGTTITPIAPANTGGAVAPNGQTSLLAGTVGVAGYLDGTGSGAKFNNPVGMTMGPDGNIYVADQAGQRIRKVTPAGVVTTFAGTGAAGAQNGNAIGQATFNAPWGLCFDKNGNMFVAEYTNHVIRKITPGGIVSTYAGTAGTAGFADAAAGAQLTALFNHPTGVVADALGNVYVADLSNYRIRKIAPNGAVTTIAGNATRGYVDAVGTLAQFSAPETVNFDPQGNLIVADKTNNMIRKITPNGTVSTLAGQLTAGYVNATGTSAKFNLPSAAVADAAGNIYVTDYTNNCVRKIDPTGAVTTLSGTTIAGPNNGAGSVATFSSPYVIVIDGSGNLYIGDYLNQVVRKVLSTPYTISPTLPAGLNFDPKTGIISGAATSSSSSTTYTITAYNLSGSSTATLTFAVAAASIAPTQSMNYITTYTSRVANFSQQSQVTAASLDKNQVETNIQYFDGLGRPLQTVLVKGSPNGRDVVQPMAYDQFGREVYKYLPYAVTGSANSDGSYKTDALTAGAGVLGFYNPTGSGTSGNQQSNGIVVNPNPYSQMVFEPSPLNRPVEQGAPGTPWQPIANSTAGHTVKVSYTTNNAISFTTDSVVGKQVALYRATINADLSRTLVASGYYSAGQLLVRITKDENWVSGRAGTVEEYTDKAGRVILKRQYNYTTVVQLLSTYYVYDDLGNLAFVLPPLSGADNAATISQTTLDNLCYQYRYDDRKRLIQKKIPGKGWQYSVYNQLDQPVLTQDALQRVNNQWTVTKYDALGRVIMTGLWNAGSAIAQSTLQTSIYAGAQWDTRDYTNTSTGYNISSYPAITTPLTINYYDDYNYSNIAGAPSNYTGPAGYSTMIKGLPTAKKTAVLNNPADMLWDVNYYDNLGRAIQSYTQHYLNGTANVNNYDLIATKYSFTNTPTVVTRLHYTTGSITVPMLTATTSYQYDHMDRKIKTWEQLTYGSNLPTGNTLVSQVDYNELGQLLTKHLHSTDGANFYQNIGYTYNERGWLLTSTAPLFAMSLFYNTATYKAYNGNIMTQYWGTPGNLNNHYSYGYDKLNRMMSGSSTIGSEQNISYDLMGNLMALRRYNNTSTLIDNLSYNYTGNQLTSVGDGSGNNSGLPNGTTSYSYDGNGNMLTQTNATTTLNKTVTYNLLNLPQSVATPPGTVTYTYDAIGQKLRKVAVINSVTTTTEYINGIQYKNSTSAIDFIQTEEGRAAFTPSTGGFDYYYYLGDNLGNTRVTFDTQTSAAAQTQKDDYYPFGLEIPSVIPPVKNEYLYNNKELQEELSEYDYGARFYDPVIARWTVVDPLADATISLSPYHYAANNPVAYKDLLGLTPHYNYSNGNYYEDDGTEVAWSYVQASISMSDGISATYKPLTRTRLVQLGEQAGYGVAGTGKFNADVGNAFEAVAAKFWGFTGMKRSFASDVRRAMTHGKKNSVEPDSWGLVTVHKWDSDHGLLSYLVGDSEVGNFVDVISSMSDVKSTGKSSISLSYDNYQVLGFLDALSNTPGGKDGRAIFSLITLSGVSVGPSVIREAQERKISIYQSVALEQYVDGRATGNIAFSVFYPIYETIPSGRLAAPNYPEVFPLDPVPFEHK